MICQKLVHFERFYKNKKDEKNHPVPMKSFEITFKNGLLIDKKTGELINLAPLNTYYI
jgi:hypothetical protein